MTDNIILVGFMGCGKTTLGKALAQHLNWHFVDTDQLIEESQGRTIKEIFATDGEARFREIERETIKGLSEEIHQIIATGGGIAKSQVNVDNLRKSGVILYLKTSPETIFERVKDDDTRPLLMPYTGEAKLQRIRDLMEERRSMYENAADLTLECDGISLEDGIRRICEMVF